jgi:hypothetical protein
MVTITINQLQNEHKKLNQQVWDRVDAIRLELHIYTENRQRIRGYSLQSPHQKHVPQIGIQLIHTRH